MYGWLRAFLTERFIRTQIKATLSGTQPLMEGLPQGSVLRCTLFLIFKNIGEAIRIPTRLSYADADIDKATVAINRDLTSFKMRLTRVKRVKLRTPPSLSATRCCRRIWIFVSGLKRDDRPRYLGVSLNPRLCLRRYIENLASSVQEPTAILQKLAGTNRGATPRSLISISMFASFIRVVLAYVNPVLNLASRTSVEKLDRIKNLHWDSY
ncbi:RNA-directed DNA polymerase from mobile element jockey-like [Plakobranchus ocellatus]|uniref:RNA-directed DNA polymerase from mobile element jockey-like n=1 Tax=Plakobranchus ocellatus TaxID=259542 RepID=A0AAV4AVT2_9GAST|nr:RNA-directed DNA polymerase from mobile element jockey-like [Plakobranchus ocellatus]